jgi:hypothetical protein
MIPDRMARYTHYRQIYAGKVKVLTQLGRIMIPRSEVERLLAGKEVYNGRLRRPPKKSALPDAPLTQEVTSAG